MIFIILWEKMYENKWQMSFMIQNSTQFLTMYLDHFQKVTASNYQLMSQLRWFQKLKISISLIHFLRRNMLVLTLNGDLLSLNSIRLIHLFSKSVVQKQPFWLILFHWKIPKSLIKSYRTFSVIKKLLSWVFLSTLMLINLQENSQTSSSIDTFRILLMLRLIIAQSN